MSEERAERQVHRDRLKEWEGAWKVEDTSVEWIISCAQYQFENQHGELLYAFLQKEGEGLKGLAPWQLYVTHSDLDWEVVRTWHLESIDLSKPLITPWGLDEAEALWLRSVLKATQPQSRWMLIESKQAQRIILGNQGETDFIGCSVFGPIVLEPTEEELERAKSAMQVVIDLVRVFNKLEEEGSDEADKKAAKLCDEHRNLVGDDFEWAYGYSDNPMRLINILLDVWNNGSSDSSYYIVPGAKDQKVWFTGAPGVEEPEGYGYLTLKYAEKCGLWEIFGLEGTMGWD
jgi:hypothetical protein